MKKFAIYAVLSSTILTMLVACGGGGGDSTPVVPTSGSTPAQPVAAVDVVDKYVGTWAVCVPGTAPAPGSSIKEVQTFTKASAASTAYSATQTQYIGTTCAGTPTYTIADTGTSTFIGTKSVGTTTVDTVTNASSARPTVEDKGISAIVSGQLRVGDNVSAKDSDGYPTALDTKYIYIKQ